VNPNAALTALMVTAARIDEDVALVRGWGEADLGRVRVEVDAAGKITDLYLDASLHGVAPDLARLIIEAQNAACVHARAAVEELERELRDDPYAAAVVSQAAAAGLASEAPSPRASRRTAERFDDDWDAAGPPETWLR
jgi:hypothetical protein